MLETPHNVNPLTLLPPLAGPGGRRKRRHTDADRLRHRKVNRLKYVTRKAAGRCAYGSCREAVEPGHSQCRAHLNRMCERALKRRTERVAQGLCICCGKRAQFWGRKCIVCRPVRSNNPLPYGARTALRRFRKLEAIKENQILLAESRAAICELLKSNTVKPKFADVIRLYAGIDDGKCRSYREVGRLMNMSGERVRQILRDANVPLAMSRPAGKVRPWCALSIRAERKRFSSTRASGFVSRE